jgi:myosin heavy subunit
MKHKNNSTSSLELFLDTICNMFGGILFIAILVAIQIRNTTDTVSQNKEPPSPQMISAMQTELVQLITDIESAVVLRETVKKTMPQPATEEEQKHVEDYNRFSAAKGEAVKKKGQLINDLLVTEKETLDLENEIKEIDVRLKEQQAEFDKLTEQERELKSETNQAKQTAENLKQEIEMLKEQIARKEQTATDKNRNTERQETLYLPKLRTSTKTQTLNLVLRFNRLYDANRRNDFIAKLPNELGTPKQDGGFMVDASDFPNKLQQLLNSANKNETTVTIFVYGDSADNFYKVRDIITIEGFEYILLPSPDDAIWTFGGHGGIRDVQ